jgi:hypothetical protein
MRRIASLIILSTAFAATALAQGPSRPFTERDPTAADVAATPMSDLNLRKSEVPPLLIAAQEKPYDLAGLDRCSRIAAAVGELDAVLGEDIDMPRTAQRGPSAGRLAQWAVGSFIPFRGAIREISGANQQDRLIQAAVNAGQARRAFLKGAGQARGCRYPASAAPPDLVAERVAEYDALTAKKAHGNRRPAKAERVATIADSSPAK